MYNRRETYRHTFPISGRPSVRLKLVHGDRTLVAEVVDLSLGGMGIDLAQAVDGVLPSGPWSLVVTLNPAQKLLSLVGELKHYQGRRYGVRFLSLPDPEAKEEAERGLWSFLIEEQRRDRRRWSKS